VISVDVIPGTRPSDKGIAKVSKATQSIVKDVNKIKEGISCLEKAIKKTKFRI
jgi:hypothetical protein